jgi:hypothetical protein
MIPATIATPPTSNLGTDRPLGGSVVAGAMGPGLAATVSAGIWSMASGGRIASQWAASPWSTAIGVGVGRARTPPGTVTSPIS